MTAARSRARPAPRSTVYDAAYASVPNWDIGRPQPAFVHLAEAGLIRGRVLDVGCGTGELSLYLARRGNEVLGIDLAPSAIQQARSKARGRRIDARFAVWDALDLGGLAEAGLTFETVVDSATFHVFGDAERDRYVDQLETVLEPNGTFFVLGDARSDPRTIYGVSPGELRARFSDADGWSVEFVVETRFERRYSVNRAYLAGIRRS